MTQTFEQLKQRFKIDADAEKTPKGIATRLAALALEEIALKPQPFPIAADLAVKRFAEADPAFGLMLTYDDRMRDIIFGIMAGMLECLTTEGVR